MTIPSSTSARGILAFFLHWARSDTRKHPHTPSGWRRIIFFSLFPLSSPASVDFLLIFYGTRNREPVSYLCGWDPWWNLHLCYSIGRLDKIQVVSCGFVWNKRRRSNATPPPNARRRSETVVISLDFLGYLLLGTYDAWEAGHTSIFFFWAGFIGCGKIPPLLLLSPRLE